MGASNSLAKEYSVVKTFNKFVQNTNNELLEASQLKELKEKAEQIFTIYETVIGNDTFFQRESLDTYFQNVINGLQAFSDCVSYIKKNNRRKKLISKVESNFSEDFQNFVNQLIKLAKTLYEVLSKIQINKFLEPLLYLELNLFNYSFNVKKITNLPFYEIKKLPIYELHKPLNILYKQKINIVSPHSTGKTSLVPLFLICRMFNEINNNNISMLNFVILIEHEISNIKNIENTLHNMSDSISISTSVSGIIRHYLQLQKITVFNPVIGILSPTDALKLIHSKEICANNLKDFVLRSIFVLDDVHLRTVETDVFVQDIKKQLNNIEEDKKLPRFVMMSAIKDERYIQHIGHVKEMVVKSKSCNVDVVEIENQNIKDIRNKNLFQSMHNFFDKWIDDKETPIGSVIVFVPSEKIGQRIYKDLYKFYRKDNATNVCPLNTSIKKGETIESFYMRLIDEMTFAEGDRLEGTKTLFLMPMFLSDNVSPEERNIIHSQLPNNVDNLSRVFITTIKNEPILQVQDLSVIFDSGIQETEIYNPEQSAIHIYEQLLPIPYIEEHINMLKNCQGGKYFQFKIKDDDNKRPKSLIPDVKKINLGKHILIQRSFGIKFEKQLNLPNEPNHDILDKCFSTLKSINVIDNSNDHNLTPLGIAASKYSFVSPFFAVATAKFKENPVFAFLCSLIIENSRSLIINPQSKLLYKHFNKDSDIVTLLDAIYEISKESIEGFEDSGLSIGTLHMIYSKIENVFKKQGCLSVIESIDWARKQSGGIIKMVDKFVLLLDKNNFLDKRKAEFIHIVGAGPGCEPTLIYKANDVFKKDKIKSEIEIIRRPGWLGLQAPGNVFVLSVIVDEQNKFNRGLLIHKDPTATEKSKVVSIEKDNPCLNSFFFVSLFEGYWSGLSIINDFIRIYHTLKPTEESAFLIHISKNNERTFVNYCPRSKGKEDEMLNSINLLSELMPFVPRSLIAKVDYPLCAIEVIADGTSYTTYNFIDLIDDPNDDFLPFAYPINKNTLSFARKNINELKKTTPKIRFGITGESFYYKSVNGREVENDLIYPNVNPNIKSVFDPYHLSHLVLLVNKDYGEKPMVDGKTIPSLKWLPNDDDIVKNNTDESIQNKMIVSAISKIMTGFGYADHNADVFFITLGESFIKVEEGIIPKNIYEKVGYKDGLIKQGIYPLIRHFLTKFTNKQKLTEPISLIKFGSTNSWKNYPKNKDDRKSLCNQIKKAVSNHFHLKPDDVYTMFIGSSLLAIRVEGLPEKLVTHKIYTKNFDDSYYPCKADAEITQVLNDIKTVDFQIKQVIHEPVITVCINHMRRLNLHTKDFTEIVKNTYDRFGFLRSNKIEYIETYDEEQIKRGILGYIEAEFYGIATGLVFATEIIQQFPKKTFDSSISRIVTCRGIETINPRLPPIDITNTTVFRVSPAEAEILRNKIAARGFEWNVDMNCNVIQVPVNDEAAAKDMILKVRNKDEDTTCLGVCDGSLTFLPQSLYAYQKDGTVKALAICRDCMIDTFLKNDSLQKAIDPLTHVVLREKLSDILEKPKGITFTYGEESDDENWPIIPIGQSFWALMSDADTFGAYLKSWFTIIIDITIRTSISIFTFCPNHPDIPIRIPKGEKNIRCQHCDMFYHHACKNWHPMDQVCDEIVKGAKCCPNCGFAIDKNGGCNHITCPRCGKHWCYACEKSAVYNTGHEVYVHMKVVHGGIY